MPWRARGTRAPTFVFFVILVAKIMAAADVVVDGTSEIVLPADAPYATRLAAEELNFFLKGVLGAPLPVVERRTAGKTNTRLNSLGDLIEVDMPGNYLAVSRNNTDKRSVKLLFCITHSVKKASVRSALHALSYVITSHCKDLPLLRHSYLAALQSCRAGAAHFKNCIRLEVFYIRIKLQRLARKLKYDTAV